ncbi:nuclear transport factor 2 family protein [Nocardioides sp. BP30]|uniref:nuclear transport factor 2 family protein n=1 Tax=Nocardioides sp. BP30 TaxID=3036374 RepID=UPI002468E3B8|nr:nuclear transport factor 2 family protein [Nocardioides sp. BP30]WGL54017.1 nuclear transport factor 2 family protein [Nocardioides sp. BP30]
MDLEELRLRERVRDTYATYAHAGDRFQLSTLADCFAEDGTLEVKGGATATGRAAIIAMLSGGDRDGDDGGDGGAAKRREPPLVRHFVANLLFTSVTPTRVESTAYFQVLVAQGEYRGVDHWGRYRDVLVPVGDRWLFRHRQVSVDVAVPEGWYAGL